MIKGGVWRNTEVQDFKSKDCVGRTEIKFSVTGHRSDIYVECNDQVNKHYHTTCAKPNPNPYPKP